MLHSIVLPDVGWPDWRQTKCLRLQPLRDQSIKRGQKEDKVYAYAVEQEALE